MTDSVEIVFRRIWEPELGFYSTIPGLAENPREAMDNLKSLLGPIEGAQAYALMTHCKNSEIPGVEIRYEPPDYPEKAIVKLENQ